MKVFVISLSDAADRRKKITDVLGRMKINFEFYDAVKGDTVNRNDNPLVYNYNSFILRHNLLSRTKCIGKLSDGELGCAYSHLNIYQKIVDEKLSHAIILEDDFLPHEGYKMHEIFMAAVTQKPKADVISGFCDTQGVRQSVFIPSRKVCIDNYQSFTIRRVGVPGFNWFLSRRRRVGSAACYCISNSACQRLLKLGFPVRMEADVLLGMVAYNKLRYYVIAPKLGFPGGGSYIQTLGGHHKTTFV